MAKRQADSDDQKKPAGKPSKKDRHKDAFLVRLPEVVGKQLDKLVEQNHSDRTEEVRRGIIEYLRGKGLWPPPQGP